VAPKALRILVHAGSNSLTDCCTLAAHAAQVGAGGIACMAPFFFKVADVPALVDWCAVVASAAPQLRFYYYHMPSMTGTNLPVAEFLAAASGRIPNLAGIKYTYEDLEDFARCLRFDNGRYDVLFGRDEHLLSALKLGARGAVGSTYNFAAPHYLRIIEAYNRGDLARAEALQAEAVQMIEAVVKSGPHPIAAFKWLMGHVGVDCGPTRPPLTEITPAQATALAARLDQFEAFTWCSGETAGARA
jgi:N-acetylneuraminate lyase